jgi:hypothetical protein
MDGEVVSHGELCFWGEWEPPSNVEELGHPDLDLPRYLHRPYLAYPEPFAVCHQNTDPFVFGEQFLYTTCKQWRQAGPTQLRFLTTGCIILFGSANGGRFLLDTVLVVGGWVDHTHANCHVQLDHRVPQAYWPVTLDRLYANHENQDRCWRLYTGAPFENCVNGMYSFFPAKPAVGVLAPRFQRPCLPNIGGVINPQLLQGVKLTVLNDLDHAAEIWQKIKEAVEDQGCSLGVHAELPENGEM